VQRLPLLLAVLAVLVGVAATAPGVAQAAPPCRDKIFNDWYHSGKIASTYPISCYRDALAHVPADAQIYSNLDGDIRLALQAALGRLAGRKVPLEVGHGLAGLARTRGHVSALGENMPSPGGKTSRSLSSAAASAAGSAPLPILVLGGLALALAAAGAIGAGVRHVRNRSR